MAGNPRPFVPRYPAVSCSTPGLADGISGVLLSYGTFGHRLAGGMTVAQAASQGAALKGRYTRDPECEAAW